MDRIASDGANVPGHWRMEVANSLRTGLLGKRIERPERDALLAQISLLPIVVDGQTDAMVWPAAVLLSDKHDLTPYDAVYLELACRRRLPLATLDRGLRRAARRETIELLGR